MNRTAKVLVISSFTGGNANVIRDFLFCFNVHSQHDYHYVFDPSSLDEAFDFGAYDVVLMFWSLYLLGPSLRPEVRARIRECPAVKLLFLQDEYRDVRAFNAIMADLGVNAMFTCVAEEDHALFYPRELIPSLKATYTVLTGYVPDYLIGSPPDLDRERPLDIAYRSREVPYWLGDLGQEKCLVADRFQTIAREHGLKVDISVKESDRIYGDAWVTFLRSARCTLGTESGASIVDLDGELRRSCERALALQPELKYADLHERFLAPHENKAAIRAISPRVFESAALGNTMVMHAGRYSGAVEAGRHFIPVQKDYSNIAEVVDQIKDRALCKRLARQAYDDLIASGRYSYRTFVRWFDGVLADHLADRKPAPGRSKLGHTLEMYRRGQFMVPRGNDVVHVPSVRGYARRALDRISGLSARVPLPASMKRMLSDPGIYLGKAITAAWIPLTDASLRPLWGAYLRRRAALPDVRMDQVAEDVAKLAVIRQLSTAGEVEFRIRREPTSGFLSIEACGSEARASEPVGNQLVPFSWDHAQVGQYVAYRVAGRFSVEFFVGLGGIHRFPALNALAALEPELVAEALRPVLQKAGATIAPRTEGATPEPALRRTAP